MRFLTSSESGAWCKARQVALDPNGNPERPSTHKHHVRLDIPPTFTRLTWFCQHIENSLQPRDQCLLWVTESGVWPSSENLHLYYKLRQSYGDRRMMDEAPGHIFLRHEAADLVSFLQVGILCGWDMYLVPTAGHARAFLSHDEFIEFASDDGNPGVVEDFARPLTKDVPG